MYLFIFYLSFRACSGIMREVPCSDASHYCFIHHLFIIYLSVPAAAVCVRHPAAA
jgi:hypothetical protein